MQEPSTSASNSSSLETCCKLFERAWYSRPRISDYLSLADRDTEQQSRVLQELLLLDIRCRRSRGESAAATDYLAEFPDRGEMIERVLQLTDAERTTTLPTDMEVHSTLPARGTDTPPPSGSTIAHFELQACVGTGAFGSVWKAVDTRLRRIVAVKLPRWGGLSESDTRAFLREAQSAAQLRHPNIVPVFETGEDSGRPYIVSGFVEGMTLADWLSSRRVSPREAAEMCAKIAGALHFAHEHQVVHRDLKPSNILVDAAGEPQITDFGLAKHESADATMTAEGQVLGTPAYMSPEQARGDSRTADCRTDLYALGVILFELLTRERPFRGNVQVLLEKVLTEEAPSPRTLNDKTPRDLETICLKCLEKSPSDRYASAQAVQDELDRYLRGEPILTRPITSFERSLRWCRRNPLAAAVWILMLLLLVSAGLGWLLTDRARRESERQTTLAKQRFELAREVVDSLLVDFSDNPDLLAGSPGTRRIRRTVLERARAYYAMFVKEMEGGTLVQRDLAMAHARIAMIDMILQPGDRAIEDFRKATEMLRTLVTEADADPETQLEYGKTLAQLALHYETLGRGNEATAARASAIEQLESRPDDPRFRFALGDALNDLANQQCTNGKFDQAATVLQRAIDLLDSASADTSVNPGRVDYTMASCYFLRGIIRNRGGDTETAASDYKSSETLYRALLRSNESAYPQELVESCLLQVLHNLAGVALDRDSALAYAEEAAQLANRLATDYPDDKSHQRFVVVTFVRLGQVQEKYALESEAETSLSRAADLARKRLDPQLPDTLRVAIEGNLNLIILRVKRYSDLAGVLRLVEETEELLGQLESIGELHFQERFNRVRLQIAKADCLERLDNLEQAYQVYTELNKQHAGAIENQMNQIACRARMGDVAQALDEWRSLSAAARFEVQDKAWPTCARVLASLSSQSSLDANRLADEAISYIARIPPTFQNPIRSADLALHPCFAHLRNRGDFSTLHQVYLFEEGQDWSAARDLLQTVVEQRPTDWAPVFHSGVLAGHLNRWSDASRDFQQAIQLGCNDARAWRFAAMAEALQDDADEYRRICRSMVERFGTSEDARERDNLIRTLTFAPGAAAETPEHVLARLDQAGQSIDQGALLYRLGRFREATERFQPLGDPTEQLWKALAHIATGTADATVHEHASSLVTQLTADTEKSGDAPWFLRTEARLVLRESQAN